MPLGTGRKPPVTGQPGGQGGGRACHLNSAQGAPLPQYSLHGFTRHIQQPEIMRWLLAVNKPTKPLSLQQ